MDKLDEQLHEIGNKTPDLDKDLSSSIYNQVQNQKKFHWPYFFKFAPGILAIVVVVMVASLFTNTGSFFNYSSESSDKNNGKLAEDVSIKLENFDKNTSVVSFNIETNGNNLYLEDFEGIESISSDNAVVFYENGINGARYVLYSGSLSSVELDVEYNTDTLNAADDGEGYHLELNLRECESDCLANGSNIYIEK